MLSYTLLKLFYALSKQERKEIVILIQLLFRPIQNNTRTLNDRLKLLNEMDDSEFDYVRLFSFIVVDVVCFMHQGKISVFLLLFSLRYFFLSSSSIYLCIFMAFMCFFG